MTLLGHRTKGLKKELLKNHTQAHMPVVLRIPPANAFFLSN